MRALCQLLVTAALLASAFAGTVHAAERIKIVAAENFYGDVAAQVAGPDVEVLSILENPNQDPHLFESSPSTARVLSAADIVIYNGANYDPWMGKLLAASPRDGRTAIVAAELIGAKSGGNPHVWYHLDTLPKVAEAVAVALEGRDPARADVYRRNLAGFQASFRQVVDEARGIAAQHKGTAVTATEPVFGYMAEALGFKMLNTGFQTAVMNDTEPSASQMIAFEDSLTSGTPKILFYNKQVSDKTTERLMEIARRARIPVIGITETKPRHLHVQAWFTRQLDDVKRALGGGTI